MVALVSVGLHAAVTMKVYGVPGVKPLITYGDVAFATAVPDPAARGEGP